MKKHIPTVSLGSREYKMTGVLEYAFPGFGIIDKWDVFSSGTDHYILCAKMADHVIFLELSSDDDYTMKLGREWRRRPRGDGIYALGGKHKKYYGVKQPTSLTQKVRSAA